MQMTKTSNGSQDFRRQPVPQAPVVVQEYKSG